MAKQLMKRRSSFPKKDSPLLFWETIIGAVAPTIIGNLFGRKKKSSNRQQLQQSTARFDELFKTYRQSVFQPLDIEALKQENIYKDQENIYEDQENIFLGRENIFEDQENVFEELEVDTQAVDYAREQFQQQQAGIIQGLRGTAGSSGVAGLAQTLSGQATKQAREAQLTIGQQLQQNRKMKLQEQSRLNQQERAEQARLSQMGLMEQSRLNQMSLAEQSRLSQMSLAEQSRINQQDRQLLIANMEGARQFEIDKLTTLLGVEGQRISGAQGAIASRQSMYGDIAGGLGTVAGSLLSNVGYTKEGGWTLG